MHRAAAVLVVLATALLAALFAHAGAAGDANRFRTADAGAACKLEATTLVCGSLGSAGSLALRGTGDPRVVRRLPWWDASTPVLKAWHRHGVSCRATRTAIICTNRGATIRVDRAGFAVTV